MDSAVISSIVTGVIAIVAGLVSAFTAAHFTQKHSAATLEANRKANEEQWRRAQEKDHLVWLRDQKQSAYIDFFREAEHQLAQLSKWPSADSESPAVDTHQLSLHRGRIKIIGNPGIRLLAREVESGLKSGQAARNMVFEHGQESPNGILTEKTKERQSWAFNAYMSQLDELHDDLVTFVLVVRQDLGTATPDDEHLNELRGTIIDIPEAPASPNS